MPTFTYKGEPPKLDIDTMKGTQVKTWKKQWMGYVDASGLNGEPETRKLNVLYQCLSPATIERLDILEPNVSSMEGAVNALVDYAQGQISLILDRKRFVERRQRIDESAYDYSLELKQMLSKCQFHQADADPLLATFFVVGLKDPATMEAILALNNPTFDQAVTVAKSREAASHTRKGFQESQNQNGGNVGVNKTSADKSRAHANSSSSSGTPSSACPWCGHKTRHTRNTCPAASQTCRTCNKKGHYSRVCRSGPPADSTADTDRAQQQQQNNTGVRQLTITQQQQLANIQRQQQRLAQQQQQVLAMGPTESDEQWLQESTVAHIFAIDVNATTQEVVHKAPRTPIECTVGNIVKTVMALPDTGADISAVGPSFLEVLEVHQSCVEPTDVRPRAADGSYMRVLGTVNVSWSLNGHDKVEDKVFVIEGTEGVLLSWRTVRALGLLAPTYPNNNNALTTTTLAVVANEPDEDEEHEGEVGKRARHYRTSLLKEFPDVFSSHIKIMKGEAFKIELTDDAEPRAIRAARPVPLALREPLRRELQALQQRDIIEPVTEPSDWCSPIVLEDKPNGGVRLCVDLTHLNRYVKREFYISDPPHILVSTIPSTAKFFTTIDATKGYHQCLLETSSRPYTTFLTPFGRFRYKRAPFGICSISEHYNRRMDEALEGMDEYKRTTDDILLHDDELHEHYEHTRQALLKCRQQSITLSAEKFKFGRKKIKFAGYEITQGKYKMDTEITKAISHFPPPQTRKELRSFVGLVNQLSASTKSIAALLTDLRPLLSSKNEFIWDSQHQTAFLKVREALGSAETLRFYIPGVPVRLTVDASRTGLGFTLEQRQQNDGDEWGLIQAGSRMLTETESRYAPIELELLAVCFAVRKSELYLKGVTEKVVVRTDHKPLINILNHKGLYEVENPRLRRMKEYLMQFQLVATHVPGKDNGAADALSRSPVGGPIISSISHVSLSAAHLLPHDQPHREGALREAVESDAQCKWLRELLVNGAFPTNRTSLEAHMKEFWPVRDELSVHGGIIFMGKRVVVPRKLRPQVLHTLHSGHQGITKTQARARMMVYWPGIDREIEDVVSSCPQCLQLRPKQKKQPINQHVRPKGPGQHCAADLFELNGRTFLVVTDLFSTWPEVVALKDTTSKGVVMALDDIWARMGLPDVLYSDGGPQFNSTIFKEFMQKKDIQHVFSAPTYPQSNSHAEAAVKVVKRLLQKNWGPQGLDSQAVSMGLRQYRNTPNMRDGLSPAQKMFGRQLRDEMTFITPQPLTEQELKVASKRAEKYDSQVAERYDRTSRVLEDVTQGDRVLVWNTRECRFTTRAIVLAVDHRRVRLKTATGTIERDRRHVLKPRNGRCQSGGRRGPGTSTPTGTRQDEDSTLWRWHGATTTGDATNTSHSSVPDNTANHAEETNEAPTPQPNNERSPTPDTSTGEDKNDGGEPQHTTTAGPGGGDEARPSSTGESSASSHTREEGDGEHPPQLGGEGDRGRPTTPKGEDDRLTIRLQRGAEGEWTVPQPEALGTSRAIDKRPKEVRHKEQRRHDTKVREAQRRQQHQDTRRSESSIIADAEESMSFTQALTNAFATVRRGTRERRAPERWADLM